MAVTDLAPAMAVTPATGPRRGTFLLAHGAGVAMDSPFMERAARLIAGEGLDVVRFEFAYMAGRRDGGKKRPPPAAERLVQEFAAALGAVLAATEGAVAIGGKSLGGRVAAMLAGAALDPRVIGYGCLGYPFHAPDKPEAVRLEPLAALTVPGVIVQGERDPFGSRAEVALYPLPGRLAIVFAEDGSHDLAPRGGSPATWEGNMAAAARAIAGLFPAA